MDTSDQDLGLPLVPGDKVLDTITGREGVVTGGRVEHTPPRQVILVTLHVGGDVERVPADLHKLPAGLVVSLDDL